MCAMDFISKQIDAQKNQKRFINKQKMCKRTRKDYMYKLNKVI